MTLPSQEYLQSRIDYNPETGEARWKLVDCSHGSDWKRFNTRYAGTLLPKDRCTLLGKTIKTNKLLYKLHTGQEPTRVLQSSFIDCVFKPADVNIPQLAKLKKDTSLLTPIKEIPINIDSLLSYHHITGLLYILPRPNNPQFNAQWANKIAGSEDDKGYKRITVLGTNYYAHRIAWRLYYNTDPGIYRIDHIDCNPFNNCINNLRLASNSLNIQYSSRDGRGYDICRNKYRARISVNNVYVSLGSYNTAEEASEAYNAALELYKPIYKFTKTEQELLDNLYSTYPNCSKTLQRACHDIQVKALNYYVDAAIVQTPKANYNLLLQNP